MLLGDTLNAHLKEADRTATKLYNRLVMQLAAGEEVADALKAADRMQWVRHVGNIQNRARERERRNPVDIRRICADLRQGKQEGMAIQGLPVEVQSRAALKYRSHKGQTVGNMVYMR